MKDVASMPIDDWLSSGVITDANGNMTLIQEHDRVAGIYIALAGIDCYIRVVLCIMPIRNHSRNSSPGSATDRWNRGTIHFVPELIGRRCIPACCVAGVKYKSAVFETLTDIICTVRVKIAIGHIVVSGLRFWGAGKIVLDPLICVQDGIPDKGHPVGIYCRTGCG